MEIIVLPYFLICGAITLYLNIRGLQKRSGKFFVVVLESPVKVLDFLSAEEWEP